MPLQLLWPAVHDTPGRSFCWWWCCSACERQLKGSGPWQLADADQDVQILFTPGAPTGVYTVDAFPTLLMASIMLPFVSMPTQSSHCYLLGVSTVNPRTHSDCAGATSPPSAKWPKDPESKNSYLENPRTR